MRRAFPQFLIGIDCGVSTGVAVYDRKAKKYEGLYALDFWRVLQFVLTFNRSDVLIVIENPALNQFSYARHRQVGRDALKIARNAGGNCREAELLIAGLQLWKYEVWEIKPVAKKWTAEQFKRHTGYEGSTNEHVRDAGALVYGY
jgi:hypothetical protein